MKFGFSSVAVGSGRRERAPSAEADAKEERRADQMWLRGVKYALVNAIEACIDLAQHVCSSEGWGPPRDNAEAMLVLGRHGVLEPDLAERMRAAVGFRNVLVHQYGDVDDEIVQDRLGDLGDSMPSPPE